MLTKSEYINSLIDIVDQFLGDSDYEYGNVKRYLYCILDCQGYSKNQRGHLEIDFNKGLCYCYRCVKGTSLFSLLKMLKNSTNSDYIDNLLAIYYNYYDFKLNNAYDQYENYNSYTFTIDNIYNYQANFKYTDIQLHFLQNRFPHIDNNSRIKLTNIFKFYPVTNSNDFIFKTYFNKFDCKYVYTNNEYVKKKVSNKSIINDKKDYYYSIFNYEYNNLFISEGIIDLMTLYTVNPLYNTHCNYLALCSRNYKYLYEFLLNTGKFFYNNIYLVLDNDVNRKNFIYGVMKSLNNYNTNLKYKLYNNLYIIDLPRQYVDINQLYINDSKLSQINFNKII